MLLQKRKERRAERKAKILKKATAESKKNNILRGLDVESLDSYAYIGRENQRILCTKPTEPSIQELRKINKTRSRLKSETPQLEVRLVEIADHLASRCRVMKYQIYEIGALLTEAKRLLPHGEFRNWVSKNCDFGRTTAANCMRVYKHCFGCPEMVNYFKPTTLYEITSNSFPRDLRKILFEGVDQGSRDLAPDDILYLASSWKNREITEEEIQKYKLDRGMLDISVRAKKELESVQEFIKGKIAILEDGPRMQLQNLVLTEHNDKVYAEAAKCLNRCLMVIGHKMEQISHTGSK